MTTPTNNNWKSWMLGVLLTIALSASGYSFVTVSYTVTEQTKVQAIHAERIARLEANLQALHEDIAIMRQQLSDIHRLLLERRK